MGRGGSRAAKNLAIRDTASPAPGSAPTCSWNTCHRPGTKSCTTSTPSARSFDTIATDCAASKSSLPFCTSTGGSPRRSASSGDTRGSSARPAAYARAFARAQRSDSIASPGTAGSGELSRRSTSGASSTRAAGCTPSASASAAAARSPAPPRSRSRLRSRSRSRSVIANASASPPPAESPATTTGPSNASASKAATASSSAAGNGCSGASR